jgi:hypothetical protein
MSRENKRTVYYWFEPAGGQLGHDDGRVPRVGVTHRVDEEPVPCVAGLHASQRPLDALGYATSQAVWVVRLGGDIIHSQGKSVATERMYVLRREVDLRRFARLCAQDVIHMWDAPKVCRRYLRTGDDSLRDAARDAATDAARDAAWSAARDAAWRAAWAAAGDAARAAAKAAARDAAWRAARGAAWRAARAAAWGAAWAAAGDAARDRQNRRLLAMIWQGGRE